MTEAQRELLGWMKKDLAFQRDLVERMRRGEWRTVSGSVDTTVQTIRETEERADALERLIAKCEAE